MRGPFRLLMDGRWKFGSDEAKAWQTNFTGYAFEGPTLPLQLAREELESGAAVSTTDAPLVKLAEHVAPQLMPDGALVTVPEPLPALRTPSEYVEGGGVVPPLCGSSARKTSDRPVPFMSEVNRTYCPSGENLAKLL